MHNPPSGEPAPSEADMWVTRDHICTGQLLKIEVYNQQFWQSRLTIVTPDTNDFTVSKNVSKGVETVLVLVVMVLA